MYHTRKWSVFRIQETDLSPSFIDTSAFVVAATYVQAGSLSEYLLRWTCMFARSHFLRKRMEVTGRCFASKRAEFRSFNEQTQ
jgi:hypothetical protein